MLKRLATRIFKFYCHSEYQEDILGDLDEYYQVNLTSKGKRYANARFLADVLLLFRPALLRDKWFRNNSIYIIMVNTILKTAFRVFWKERGYALLNIIGLTVGLTASTLLLLYVDSEKSVNGFHKDLDQMYQVMEHQTSSGIVYTYESNPGPLNTTFADDFPEVEAMAAFTWPDELLFVNGDLRQKETGRWASEDFFTVFNVDFIEGSPEGALTTPKQLYLSRSTKERLFNTKPALSQTVEIDGWGTFEVTGVFEDIPNASTIDFDFIAPYVLWKQRNDWVDDWGNNGIRGIAKLQPGVDIDQFNAKIEGYVQEKLGDEEEAMATIFVQPFKDRYLYNNYRNGELAGGRITYVRLFTAVAFFILLIASINFMNLATARSTKRAKEVGIKKVVGSNRGLLLLQFMTESLLMGIFSALLSGLLVMWAIEPLNLLVGKDMSFSLLVPDQLLALLAMGIVVGLLSGIYPSLVLSNFKALQVLKGSFKTSMGSNGLRKGMVVFQFMISTTLIIATLVVKKQIDYVKNADLGYIKENVVLVPLEGELYNREVRTQLRNKLLANPNFTHATYASDSPMSSNSSTSGGFSWPEKESETETNFNIIRTDYGFLETFNIELLKGRDFDRALATDSMHVIINEQTARLMNVEEPLGHTITFWNRTGRVIGIVKDFHFSSLHSSIEPLVISLRPEGSALLNLKMMDQNKAESIAYLEAALKEFNPNYPMNYDFLEDSYAAQYQGEMVIGTLGNYFSGISIFISLLGLFGLASFAAEQRIKEVGVRKVLGASVFNLLVLMAKGFLLLVGLGLIVAAPLSYYFMNQWLEAFTYKIDIDLSVFLIAGAASLFITIATISYHALKAAYANPVNSLRTE